MTTASPNGPGLFLFFESVIKTPITDVDGVSWSAILTGAPDGLDDLQLIMFNFAATLRYTSASYIQMTVPYIQLDEIIARQNGDIVLYKNGVELYRVNFNDLRSNVGARSRKITISGRSTVAFPAPSSVPLVDVSRDDIQASGARELMVSPFNEVIPGDMISYDSILTTIGIVNINSDATETTVRLVEA